MTNFSDLPQWWRLLRTRDRDVCIKLLQCGTMLRNMPIEWTSHSYGDRMRIIGWLQRHRYLSDEQVTALLERTRPISVAAENIRKWREDHPAIVQSWHDYSPDRTHYPGPVTKNRILGHPYTQLQEIWRRGNGQMVRPVDMNDGHLENTIKLINESHGNVVAKACAMVGAIHQYFGNDDVVREHTEAICVQLQKVDVSTLYPVFDALAEEMATRLAKKRRLPIDDTIDMFNSLMDQEIASW